MLSIHGVYDSVTSKKPIISAAGSKIRLKVFMSPIAQLVASDEALYKFDIFDSLTSSPSDGLYFTCNTLQS